MTLELAMDDFLVVILNSMSYSQEVKDSNASS